MQRNNTHNQLRHDLPVYTIPGIGRRTGTLLFRAGVKTVGQFVALPELLLASTFGPSMVGVRKQTEHLLERSQKSGAYEIFQSIFGIFA